MTIIPDMPAAVETLEPIGPDTDLEEAFTRYVAKHLRPSFRIGDAHRNSRYADADGNPLHLTVAGEDDEFWHLRIMSRVPCSIDWCAGHFVHEIDDSWLELEHATRDVELPTPHGPWGLDVYEALVSRMGKVDGPPLVYVTLHAVGVLSALEAEQLADDLEAWAVQLRDWSCEWDRGRPRTIDAGV